MHRFALGAEQLGRFYQLPSRLFLTSRVNHLGTPFPLCFGLFCNGTDHAFVDIDMFDLNVGDLDSPLIGLLIQDLLDVQIQTFAFGQQLIEFVLTEHRTKRCLCQLTSRFHVSLNIDNCSLRIHDTKVKYRVNFDRHIVPGNQILCGNVHHKRSQIHPHHLLNDRDDYD